MKGTSMDTGKERARQNLWRAMAAMELEVAIKASVSAYLARLEDHAAMVAAACSDHGPRSPVGETQRIQ